MADETDVLDTAFSIDWEGETYSLDLSNLMVRQAMVIEGFTGMRLMTLVTELGKLGSDEDPPDLMKILVALFWLMRAQSGVKEPIADVDFPLLKFLPALLEGMAGAVPDDAGGAEPDPTPPSLKGGEPSPASSTPMATIPPPRRKRPPAPTG